MGGIGKVYPAHFLTMFPMLVKCLIFSGCVFLIPIGCIASDDATPPGFLEGHLKIISPREVEPSDAMPRQSVTAETYAEYPLIVLSQDGQKQIARLTADGNGSYRVALPRGAYVLDVQDRAVRHLRARSQPFSVVSNQTVHVDMNVIIGFAGIRP
jgi:hypothetical protein